MIGLDQAGDHVKAGGLAGAVRAEQADGFPALDIKAHMPNHMPAAIAFADSLNDQIAVFRHGRIFNVRAGAVGIAAGEGGENLHEMSKSCVWKAWSGSLSGLRMAVSCRAPAD